MFIPFPVVYGHTPVRVARITCCVLALASLGSPLRAQVAGQSVNMVTGTQWPGGDPFLERQNEPSMAVSSRNPLHVVAGNNDYRTVDLPGVASNKPTGDAWLGFFTSFDGGDTWSSVLLPGYPQDTSSQGDASPLKAYEAEADPMVRAGSNGLFYYSGLAFNREANGTSAVFVAHYIDDNNLQGANTIRYLATSVVATGDANHFLDKPAIAVDIPRPGSATCTIPASSSVKAASIPAGRIYVAYTQFNGPESSNQSAIMFSESRDCGSTWSTPQKISGPQQTNQGAALAIDPSTGNVYVVWRIFKAANQPDALAGTALHYGTNTFTRILEGPISPFDQATTDISFRTNAYPSLAVDASGRLYVAWAQRGPSSNSATGGDARIQVISGKPVYGGGNQLNSMQFAGPVTVDPYQGRGHQIMPAMAFASGKLTVAWYDFRDDDEVAVYTAIGEGDYSFADEVPEGVTPIFSNYVADPAGPPYPSGIWRHTVDVRAAQANPGLPPAFRPSVMVSQYTYGTPAFDPSTQTQLANDPENIQQLEFDAPNLPLFQLGTVPFVGDYIDVAGPTLIPYASGGTEQWRFNNLAGDPDHTHVVWTDNRNVVQPADGNWANYTPVGETGGTPSIFNPSETAPACVVGQTGIRNQDIYTATLSPGVIMGAKGNRKQLSPSLQREFPVTIENPTAQAVYYLLTIQAQPTGGKASFLQFPVSGLPNPMTQLEIGVPAYSSASRSVFVTSSNPNATVPLHAVQTDANSNVIPNGLTSSTSLNSDVSNPNISNPNISNMEIYNPNISNPNISNPNISNPNISNPNISNPNISNVAFANPNISNPNISNPNISNPNISNPNISNPNISNMAISGEITDGSFTVTNSGNTSAAYDLTLLQYQPPPQGVTVQLIVSGVYLTPVANGCTLAVQSHYVPIANIPNPPFVTPGSVLQSGPPSALAPTFTLQPGEQALVTLRVYDPNATTPAQALQQYNPLTALAPVIGSQGVNTGSPAPPTNLTVLSIATSALPAAPLNAAYSVTLQATGGSGTYTWSIPSGSLPPGITLTNGVLAGTATGPGTYTVPIQVSDMSGQTVQRTLTLVVAAPSLGIATTALPSGQFNTPYSSTLSASGGTPPYTWSVAQGGVLPVGMGLNSASGTLSGAPAQAGLWNVPITVTDSAAPASTQTVTLPLTVGLATGYAGGQNCYMPYPATPLYLAGALSWSVNTSALPLSGEMSILQGNVLIGCLTGVNGTPFNSGNYTLQFTASTANGPLTFPLTLPVVGQDQFSNGTFYADTGGVGNLPPSGFQQGVVTPGQQFSYTPGYWGANATNFSGNYLFGLSGGAPHFCVGASTTSGPISLTAPQPGRYDVLFDGTNQTCQQATAFPSSPAPLAIDSVDAIPTTVTYIVTVTSVNLNSNNPPRLYAQVTSAESGTLAVPISFNYTISDSACPDCIDQIEVGLNHETGPQVCVYNDIDGPNGVSGTANTTLNVPSAPGRYYVAFDRGQDTSCMASTKAWWNGPRSILQTIGIIDVLP